VTRLAFGGSHRQKSEAGSGHRRFPLAIVMSRFPVGAVRLFLCSTAHRFSVPTLALAGAPRAAAVKTGPPKGRATAAGGLVCVSSMFDNLGVEVP
jgi:hypothetical protein